MAESTPRRSGWLSWVRLGLAGLPKLALTSRYATLTLVLPGAPETPVRHARPNSRVEVESVGLGLSRLNAYSDDQSHFLKRRMLSSEPYTSRADFGAIGFGRMMGLPMES